MRHSLHLEGNSWRAGGESAIDHLIAALAWRQYGIVTRQQLRDLGLSDGEITYRVEIGRLRVIHKGVYAVGHERLAAEARWLAAVYAGGEDAALSHRSAARLWGLLPWEGRVEVTTAKNRRRHAGLHFVRASVESFERTEHRAIPVTTVARTLLDLGTVDARRVPKALEQADVLQLLDVRQLQRLVDEHPRRPGTRAIRAALAAAADWRGITRSELEQRFRDVVANAGLPAPATNCSLDLGLAFIEADAVWHDARLIVELDGYAYHRTAAAFERDRERDRAAVAAGWRVVRITWRQLAGDRRGVVRDLRRALSPPGGQ
jgi:predicted transcriptional regulator of viral defense system